MSAFQLEMYRGSDFTMKVVIQKDNQPFNLAEAIITFAARVGHLDTPPLFQKQNTQDGGIEVLDEANGLIQIDVAPADTLPLSNEDQPLVADLTVEVDDKKFVVASGTLTVRPVAISDP